MLRHVIRSERREESTHVGCSWTGGCKLSEQCCLQAGETRRKHEIHDFIERGLAVAESERAKATLVSLYTSHAQPFPMMNHTDAHAVLLPCACSQPT